MQVNDLRLGRLVRSKSTTVVGTITNTITLPANMQRIGLLFGVAITGGASNNGCQVAIDGIPLLNVPTARGSTQLLMSEVGDFVTKSVLVTVKGSCDFVSVTEFFLPEDVIASNLSQFRSYY